MHEAGITFSNVGGDRDGRSIQPIDKEANPRANSSAQTQMPSAKLMAF